MLATRQGHAVDPFTGQSTETQLREALHQSDLATTVRPDLDATPGALARSGLLHLADQDHALVARAITVAPTATRFDPATLAVGALVLMAFRADIKTCPTTLPKAGPFSSAQNPSATAQSASSSANFFGVFTDPEP